MTCAELFILTVRGTVKTETLGGWVGFNIFLGWIRYHTPKGRAGRLFKTVAHQNDDVKGDLHAPVVSLFFVPVFSYARLRCSDICKNQDGGL